jgi:transposase
MTTVEMPDLESLQNEISILRNCITHRDEKIGYLEEQLAWLKRQIFGKKSERMISDFNNKQLQLEGFENQESPVEEETETVPSHTRRKPNRNGQDKISLPSDLPVERTVLDIPEEQKICQETGEKLVKIGEEVSLKLAHRPESYYIKEIVRPKYAHPQKEEKGILTAELPDSIIPKCRADESLLAEIITKKFADHLPLYRICEGFERNGIRISRKLLSQWVVRIGIALKPLCDEMRKRILESNNVFIDESPVRMQEVGACKQCYIWVLVGGKATNPPYRVYEFRENRCHDNAAKLLANYHGVLHSDKYGAYETLAQRKQIIWCPCWAHIRRKFFEAEGGDPPFREWVLSQINLLFEHEEAAWNCPEEERLKIRQEQEVPIIDELIKKINERITQGRILPKSKFREALGYFCGLIPFLKNYTQHPYARLDNNVAERAIRPLAIGRKNWLFFGSPDGGEAAAVLLSLVQTCRGLGINPQEYLEDTLRKYMSHNAQKLHELLPDQWAANHAAQSNKGG